MKLRMNFKDRHGKVTSVDGEALPNHPLVDPPPGLGLTLPQELIEGLLFSLERALEAVHACHDVGIKETTFDTQRGIEVLGGEGPTSRLYGFCAAVRPFMLNNDRLYFPKLVKSIQQLEGKVLREWGKRLRSRWDHAGFGSTIHLHISGVDIDSKTILNSFFNSRTFHTEPERDDVVPFAHVSATLGGERQATAFVYWLLRDQLGLILKFFENVAAMSPEFKAAFDARLKA